MTTTKAAHKATAIYEELTDGLRLDLRVTDLVYQAAERYPDVLPTRAEIDREREHIQSEKQGLEIGQGEFVAEVLADPRLGFHLMHAMSQPRAEALDHIDCVPKDRRLSTSARSSSSATVRSAGSRSRTTRS